MAQTLGKGDIAGRVATKLKATHAEGTQALNAVLDGIVEALKDGHTVTLTGFGTFEIRAIKERQIRTIRGPQAGQLVSVPAHQRPGFRAGSDLVRAVEGHRAAKETPTAAVKGRSRAGRAAPRAR